MVELSKKYIKIYHLNDFLEICIQGILPRYKGSTIRLALNPKKGKNHLEEIDTELLHKSRKLEHMVIDHNKLTVPLVEWQKYGNNVHLSLAENPWHCDCPMLIFINSILNEGWFP